MVVLDIAVVNVAIPAIRASLDFSAPGTQWVASAYTLAFAGFLLAGGRAADLYGSRRIFTLGLALFTIASLGAGLSPTVALLIASRVLQGLGAALLSPATLTVLVTELHGKRQTRAVGIWASMSGVGGGLGVLVGGLLTQELSWRWIFFINVPIGILLLAVAWAALGRDHARAGRRDLDLLGATTITAGMVFLIFALVHAGTTSWTSALTVGSGFLGIMLVAAFWRIESRWARNPLLPLQRLHSRSLIGANVVVLLLYSVIIAPWFLFSYYMQTVLGFNALLAGIGLVPQAIVIAAASNVSSKIAYHRGPRVLIMAGPMLAVAGLLDMWWQVANSSRGGYLSAVLGPLILLGLAIGCTLPAATLAATSDVSAGEVGFASGLLNASRQFGGALGLAILFTIGTARSESQHTARAVPPGYPTAALVGVGIAIAASAAAFLFFRGKGSQGGAATGLARRTAGQ
jgi:EmrB/QacA subfamily drug resistance transporter